MSGKQILIERYYNLFLKTLERDYVFLNPFYWFKEHKKLIAKKFKEELEKSKYFLKDPIACAHYCSNQVLNRYITLRPSNPRYYMQRKFIDG